MIFTITRIRTPKDGRGSKENRVRIANSQPKNEHGCTFFGVPAGVIHSAPRICTAYLQKRWR